MGARAPLLGTSDHPSKTHISLAYLLLVLRYSELCPSCFPTFDGLLLLSVAAPYSSPVVGPAPI